jgi:polysaccharide deacetylase family protein (PEP-CTERM system associated)
MTIPTGTDVTPSDAASGPPPITVTVDVEDHRPSPTWDARYDRYTRRFLDFFDDHGIRATFFVVGQLAERSPALVAEISRRGHEVGLHGYRHWAVFSYEPAQFAAEVSMGKAKIEDIVGDSVAGFRAPAGTILPRTVWATDVLAEVGFEYSASILPAQSYVVGFPGAPAVPFRWPSGLIEAPCPALAAGSIGVPFMGGTFLRVFPLPLVRLLARRLPADSAPWTYAHPYDIDPGERFWVVPEVSWWGSLLLWTNRGVMLRKMEHLVRGRVGEPLGERLRSFAPSLEIYRPDLGATASESGDLVKALRTVLQRERNVRELSPRVGGDLDPVKSMPEAAVASR